MVDLLPVSGLREERAQHKNRGSPSLGHRKQTHRRRQEERLRPEEELTAIMPALTAKQVSLHLKSVPGWSKRAQAILRTFKFEGFLKAIDFVNQIARKAQRLNHHPDIDIRFEQVTLKLTTHDEGGITEKDFSLARQCDEVFAKWSGS